MRLSTKSLLSAAVGLLLVTATAALYLPGPSSEYQLYRRAVRDLAGYPSHHYDRDFYDYAPPVRLYRRTKVANDNDHAYTLKAHLQPGSEDPKTGGPGHSTLFVSKGHSGKSTKYQAKYATGVPPVSETEMPYVFDKKKLQGKGKDGNHLPRKLYMPPTAESWRRLDNGAGRRRERP